MKPKKKKAKAEIGSAMADEMELEKNISVLDPFKGLLVTYFMPETCYDDFFLNFNFLNGKCRI